MGNLKRISTQVSAAVLGNTRHSKMFTFSHISGRTTKAQTVRGRMIRYLHVKEQTGVNVTDGMAWKRIPRRKEVGNIPMRICLYFDPESKEVVSLPRTG